MPDVKSQSTTASKKGSAVMKIYARYEPLAEVYAKRIYRSEKIGFSFEDLVQEFRTKIYVSIIAYAAYYEKKMASRYKPWPMKLYIRCALRNKYKDLIKLINAQPEQAFSIEGDEFDYSEYGTMESHIVWSREGLKCEINGVNLLEGLTQTEARCFMLFLRGYTIAKLRRVFQNSLHGNVAEMIQRQVAKLQTRRQELQENTVTKYARYFADTEN